MKSSFNHRPRKRVSVLCQAKEGSKYKTKQSFKEQCDINRIMRKYNDTGMLDHLSKHQLDYTGLFTVPKDAQDAMERVAVAREAFERLPSHVRAKFQNDPGKFYNYATDEANYDGLVQLGLARRRVVKDKGDGASGSPASEDKKVEVKTDEKK